MPARNSHYARGSASTAPQRQFCPEWWGLTTWLDAVLQNAPPSPYLINIGASDKGAKLGAANADAVGLRMDNTSFRGFAADPGHWRIYGERKNPNVVTARTAVTPSNIVSLLDAARAPADPHLLKVDIDSYDADVVRAVLTTRQPTFIFVELNEKIPPPLSLCFHYRAWSPWHFWHRGGHHYGCSLSAYSELLRGLGYSLVSVILNDALYVRTKRAAAAGFHRPAAEQRARPSAQERPAGVPARVLAAAAAQGALPVEFRGRRVARRGDAAARAPRRDRQLLLARHAARIRGAQAAPRIPPHGAPARLRQMVGGQIGSSIDV